MHDLAGARVLLLSIRAPGRGGGVSFIAGTLEQPAGREI